MQTQMILVMAALIWTGALVAEAKEAHPGQTCLLRYIELVNEGDVDKASKLERRSPKIPPDAWQRLIQDLHQVAQKKPLKIRESWEVANSVLGATGEISLRVTRKDVLVIGTSEIDGQWYISTFTAYSPSRWDKTRARIMAEGGKLIFEADATEN